MTIKELRKVTKCHILIEWTDSEGAVKRTEWTNGGKDWQIRNIKIVHADVLGFSLAVELEEDGI